MFFNEKSVKSGRLYPHLRYLFDKSTANDRMFTKVSYTLAKLLISLPQRGYSLNSNHLESLRFSGFLLNFRDTH